MHVMNANPTTHPDLSGGRQRHVLGTTAIRPIRLDAQSDATLASLKRVLAGKKPGDIASVSLIARRALAVYWGRVAQCLTDAHALEAERLAVRNHSKMPTRRKEMEIRNHAD